VTRVGRFFSAGFRASAGCRAHRRAAHEALRGLGHDVVEITRPRLAQLVTAEQPDVAFIALPRPLVQRVTSRASGDPRRPVQGSGVLASALAWTGRRRSRSSCDRASRCPKASTARSRLMTRK